MSPFEDFINGAFILLWGVVAFVTIKGVYHLVLAIIS